jgi:hypothetical protein
MIDLKNKKILAMFFGGVNFRFGLNRLADWRRLVLLFIFVNIFNLIFGIYKFITINSGRFFEADLAFSSASAEIIDRRMLQETIEFFDQRQLRLRDVGAKSYPTDPAI